jgi:hypothetical protein
MPSWQMEEKTASSVPSRALRRLRREPGTPPGRVSGTPGKRVAAVRGGGSTQLRRVPELGNAPVQRLVQPVEVKG